MFVREHVGLGSAGLSWLGMGLGCREKQYSPELRPDRLAEEEDLLGCSLALGHVKKGPQLLRAT